MLRRWNQASDAVRRIPVVNVAQAESRVFLYPKFSRLELKDYVCLQLWQNTENQDTHHRSQGVTIIVA